MNFIGAKRNLKKLAGKKYHSLSYTISTYGDGSLTQQCSVYIDGSDHFSRETWGLALKALRQSLAPPLKVEIDNIEEIKNQQ